MTKRSLDIQLTNLQEGADAHYETYRRNHEQLWKLLAKSYLWWREASEQSGYLETLYKKREIGFRSSDSNVPNFNPLIRLIWNMQELSTAERATISQWNKALQSVHVHYAEHTDDFRHNAEGKLTAYIEGQGGVIGLTMSEAGYAEDDEPIRRSRRFSDKSIVSAKSKAEIARHALTELFAPVLIGASSSKCLRRKFGFVRVGAFETIRSVGALHSTLMRVKGG